MHTMLSESIQEVRSCSDFLVYVHIMDLGATHGCSANRNGKTKNVSGHYMQIFRMPYSTSYHQPRSTFPWQNPQPFFGTIGPIGLSMHNPCMGTPVASSNAYNNQLTYLAHPRESQYESTISNHILLPMHNLPQGATFSSQPCHMAGKQF